MLKRRFGARIGPEVTGGREKLGLQRTVSTSRFQKVVSKQGRRRSGLVMSFCCFRLIIGQVWIGLNCAEGRLWRMGALRQNGQRAVHSSCAFRVHSFRVSASRVRVDAGA
jgi:hypothetical protein